MKFLQAFLLFLLMAAFTTAHAQNYKISDDPEVFVTDLAAILSSTKNTAATKAGEEFVMAWRSGKLQDSDKKRIMHITKGMVQKKYKARPHFESFCAMIATAALSPNSQADFNNLLTVTQKVADNHTAQSLVAYCETARSLFEGHKIYSSNYNSLIAEGGSYTFDYIEKGKTKEVAPEPEPAQQTAEPANVDPFFYNFDAEPAPVYADDASSGTIMLNAAEIPEVIIPEIKGAVIIFKNINLVMASRFDTTRLTGTEGHYLFNSAEFIGEGGRFDWSIAGLPEVYATFAKYSFKVRNSALVSDKVTLHYPERVDKPLEGIFTFMSKKHKGIDDAQYPRFKSYANNVTVKNLGENIEYNGGFALAGRHIYSSSINGGPTTLLIKEKGVTRLKAVSNRFEFGDSLITSDMSYAALYLDKDSIYHHGVRLKYNKNVNDIKLYKDKGLYKNSSFIDSYHQIEIDCDVLSWMLGEESINFYILNGKTQVPATFESKEYYDDARFSRLQGLYTFHPVIMINNYANTIKKETFYLDDLATAYKQNPATLRTAMLSLMGDGFIDYNVHTGKIKVKEKTRHYVLSKNKKKDYDFIAIKSVNPPTSNASLNLSTKELKVSGVDRFYLSDSLGVYIEPENKELSILKNRELKFDGKVNAGNFLTHGRDIRFDYDNFKVDMNQIDSILVRLDVNNSTDKGKKANNKPMYAKVESRSQESTGTLYVNNPKNKSGKQPLPQYPILGITTDGYVYFDKKEFLNKAYDQRIFFKLPPFEVDSLASTNPSSVVFAGSFVSDGIFPEFKDKLTIRPDKTLGFAHQVPTAGYTLYGGEGKFFGNLTMDGKGLRGDGEIRYMASVIKSDAFVFYQDSVIADGKTVVIKEGRFQNTNFPDVIANNFKMKWYPKTDSLIVYNAAKDPIYLYGKSATLEGRMIITSKGLLGDGLLKTRTVQIVSRQMNYDVDKFSGNNAEFIVKSDIPLKPAVLSRNVKFNFNLKDGYADFAPEVEGFASVEFPYAQYKTSISKAVWDLNKKLVTMSSPKGGSIASSFFYSTHPDQDSLVFNATDAVYDMEKLSLNITGVPYIYSADAKIIPDGNKVTILEKANMQPLANASIMLDTLNEYHKLTQANIKIKSRREFLGDAVYQYITPTADTFPIRFDKFDFIKEESRRRRSEDIVRTVSGGTIAESKPLLISTGILYKGNVTMHANKKNLVFDGEIKLDVKNKNLASSWLKYSSTGDGEDFVLNLQDAKDLKGNPLVTGLHFENGSSNLYYTFVSEKKVGTDQDLFKATGLLNYSPQDKLFKVGSQEKISGKSYEGSLFTYSDSLSMISYEGKLNFIAPQKADKNVTFLASGAGSGRIDTNTFMLNTLIAADFGIPGQAMEAMGKVLSERVKAIGGFEEDNTDRVGLLYKVAEIVGNKAAIDYDRMSTREFTPLSKMSGKLAKGIVITNANLQWSPQQNAWYSVGKIGVSNINRHDINVALNGHIEIKKTYNGELVNIYLEASPDTWYFFSYDDQKRVSVLSSEADFNNAVAAKSKAGKNRPGDFYFTLADVTERVLFVKAFNKNYYGMDVVPSTVKREAPVVASETPEKNTGEAAEENSEPKGKASRKKEKAPKKQDKTPEVTQPQEVQKEPAKKKVDEDADGF